MAALNDERCRTWEPGPLAVNVNQRQTLVDSFDPVKVAKVGDRLAPSTLVGVDGENIVLSDLAASGPLVLLLFRFAGCPACNIALPGYDRDLRPALNRLGVPLFAISPQVPERLVEIRDRHELGFTIASDHDNTLSRSLGLTYEFDEPTRAQTSGPNWIGAVTGTDTWELPITSALVIGDEGRIEYIDIASDWMVRPEPEAIIAAVQALLARRNGADSLASG